MVLSEMRLNLLKHQSTKLPTNEVALWSEEHDLEYVAVALARPMVITLTIQPVEFGISRITLLTCKKQERIGALKMGQI
jgi:hypothetical protein